MPGATKGRAASSPCRFVACTFTGCKAGENGRGGRRDYCCETVTPAAFAWVM